MTLPTVTIDATAEALTEALAANPMVPFGTFDFTLDGTRLVLDGLVDTAAEKAAIYETIDDFTGIRDIEDHLVVGEAFGWLRAA